MCEREHFVRSNGLIQLGETNARANWCGEWLGDERRVGDSPLQMQNHGSQLARQTACSIQKDILCCYSMLLLRHCLAYPRNLTVVRQWTGSAKPLAVAVAFAFAFELAMPLALVFCCVSAGRRAAQPSPSHVAARMWLWPAGAAVAL